MILPITRIVLIGALAGSAASSAQAQMFFRPFGGAYSYHESYEAQPGPYANRRSIASVLAREGYRLVGPIDWRGDRVIARGFNPREGEMRFVIDAYEGDVLSARRVGPPPAFARNFDGPVIEDDYPAQRGAGPSPRADAPQRPRPQAARPAPQARPLPQGAARAPAPPPLATAPTTAAPAPPATAVRPIPGGGSHRAVVAPPRPNPSPAAPTSASAAGQPPAPAQATSVARKADAPFQPAAPVSPIVAGAR